MEDVLHAQAPLVVTVRVVVAVVICTTVVVVGYKDSRVGAIFLGGFCENNIFISSIRTNHIPHEHVLVSTLDVHFNVALSFVHDVNTYALDSKPL